MKSLSEWKKNKRGDATDPMIILIILGFLAVTFIVVIFVNTKISSIISDTRLNESAAFPDIDAAFDQINVNAVQQGFILMFGIMIIFVIASSFLVRVHPVFLFLYIFVLIATIVAAVFVGNFYDKLQDNAELNAIMITQPMINTIMNNIVLVTMAIGGLTMLIVFSKVFDAPTGRSDFS